MGDYFADFVRDEARALGLTEDELAAWTPPARAASAARRPRRRPRVMSERVLLKDLIHIPERVHQGDFVLKLAEGVDRPAEATLRDYVVTPQLAALLRRRAGLHPGRRRGPQQQGRYLHGSFGSGKCHFMAVLTCCCRQRRGALDPGAGRRSWRKHDAGSRARSSCSCPTT